MGKLILSRKPDEKIIIRHDGREIVVTVTAVRGATVRLGIEAPGDVEIVRDDAKNPAPKAGRRKIGAAE